MRITITAISERKRPHFYIYKEQKNAKRFIYKKHDTLQKVRQFTLSFYKQKARNFTLRNFS